MAAWVGQSAAGIQGEGKGATARLAAWAGPGRVTHTHTHTRIHTSSVGESTPRLQTKYTCTQTQNYPRTHAQIRRFTETDMPAHLKCLGQGVCSRLWVLPLRTSLAQAHMNRFTDLLVYLKCLCQGVRSGAWVLLLRVRENGHGQTRDQQQLLPHQSTVL